jgi:hypothetical protein
LQIVYWPRWSSCFEELDQAEGSKHFLTPLVVKRWCSKTIKIARTSRLAHCSPPAVVHHPSGSVEIGIGNGTVKIFDLAMCFAEDTTGQGHTAKPENWVRAFAHLD